MHVPHAPTSTLSGRTAATTRYRLLLVSLDPTSILEIAFTAPPSMLTAPTALGLLPA
jgi:hypothetical protein